MASSL
jgi:CheY-like chemotaxis protein